MVTSHLQGGFDSFMHSHIWCKICRQNEKDDAPLIKRLYELLRLLTTVDGRNSCQLAAKHVVFVKIIRLYTIDVNLSCRAMSSALIEIWQLWCTLVYIAKISMYIIIDSVRITTS